MTANATVICEEDRKAKETCLQDSAPPAPPATARSMLIVQALTESTAPSESGALSDTALPSIGIALVSLCKQ